MTKNQEVSAYALRRLENKPSKGEMLLRRNAANGRLAEQDKVQQQDTQKIATESVQAAADI